MNTCHPKTITRGAPKPKNAGVPTYNSNGARLRNHTLHAIEACLALRRVVVTRNRRTGLITSAQFKPLPKSSTALEGKEEIRKHAHMGQRYSFKAAVDDQGHHAWRFVKFLTPRDMRLDPGVTPDDLERWLLQIFRAVPLSCMAR